MTQSDDLHESLRHLEYEMAMMVASPRMLAKHQLTPAENTARPDGYYWVFESNCQYLWIKIFYAASFSGRFVVGAFDEFAVLELRAPARTSATRCGALTARQRDWAASISL